MSHVWGVGFFSHLDFLIFFFNRKHPKFLASYLTQREEIRKGNKQNKQWHSLQSKEATWAIKYQIKAGECPKQPQPFCCCWPNYTELPVNSVSLMNHQWLILLRCNVLHWNIQCLISVSHTRALMGSRCNNNSFHDNAAHAFSSTSLGKQ